jgi:hypothetical protein
VATEAAGTLAARFLPLPFSSLGQFVQPLNKGCIKNLVAETSSNWNLTLEAATIRMMTLRTPLGGVKGLATRAARAAHSGPRAAAHTMASAAVYMRSPPRKATLRSGAASAATTRAHVSTVRSVQALSRILEPEMRGWAVWGASQRTRGQGHINPWVGSLSSAINVD